MALDAGRVQNLHSVNHLAARPSYVIIVFRVPSGTHPVGRRSQQDRECQSCLQDGLRGI